MKAYHVAVVLAFAGVSAFAGNVFRVTPYVQDPATTAMTLMWLAQTNGDASVTWWPIGGKTTNTIAHATQIEPTDRIAGCRFSGEMCINYCLAPELDYDCSPKPSDNTRNRYDAWEMPYTCPWQYRCRLTGLVPNQRYGYRVTLAEGASYEKTFRTAPKTWRTIRFVYYSDSETEPKDNDPELGKTSDWGLGDVSDRKYYATQTQCYASNIVHAVGFDPDLIIMAGDLAQKGAKQCDWDEFWRHNAGQLNDPAGSIPILASPGNHDYWDYDDGGNTGIAKYLSYFEFAPNGTGAGEKQQELFHRKDYGPVAFIFMDANNGNDDVLEQDTSRYLNRTNSILGKKEGCIAPDFNPGSVQYQWLAAQLADAQKTKAFTFVVCHQCPYSCGYHGGEIGEPGSDKDDQTGRALRVLEPLFHRYGVDAWLCGHDEMMERSEIDGTEVLPDGTEVAHKIHVWDMGIAGDGLRGGVINENPKEKFRAGKDAVEQFDANGTLTDGGRHYGHMEVEVSRGDDGKWRATFSPTYVFVTTNEQGQACGFDKRTYNDVVTMVQQDIDSVTVTKWFDETTNTIGTTGVWMPENPSVTDNRMIIDASEEPSVFTPFAQEPEGVTTRVSMCVCPESTCKELPVLDDAQAAALLYEQGDEVHWAFLGADGWHVADVPGVATDPTAEYELEILFDYAASPARVTYSFKTSQGTVTGWTGSAAGQQSRMNSLSFGGSGSGRYMRAEYETPVVPPNGLILYLK